LFVACLVYTLLLILYDFDFLRHFDQRAVFLYLSVYLCLHLNLNLHIIRLTKMWAFPNTKAFSNFNLQIIIIFILQISYIAAHGIHFYVLYIVFFAEIALSSQATAATIMQSESASTSQITSNKHASIKIVLHRSRFVRPKTNALCLILLYINDVGNRTPYSILYIYSLDLSITLAYESFSIRTCTYKLLVLSLPYSPLYSRQYFM